MELDGLFLDFYGTIATGDRQAVEAVCAHVIGDTGLDMSAHELAIVWGDRFFAAADACVHDGFRTLHEIELDTLQATLAKLGHTIDPVPYSQEFQEYLRKPPVFAEVGEFFARFPLPICIVSNADRAELDAAIRNSGIAVAEVVTSEDARAYKPDPRIFEYALEQTGWHRERVLHVGDSLHADVGGALAAGVGSGWVNREHRIHDIGEHEPEYEFADLLEVAALVDGVSRTPRSISDERSTL